MQLTVKELKAKVKALKEENKTFAEKAQADLTKANQNIQQLQGALQAKVTEAQREIDLRDGKVKGLEDLIQEMGGSSDEKPASEKTPEKKPS